MIITYSWLDQYKIIGLNDLSDYFQSLSVGVVKYCFSEDARQSFGEDIRQSFGEDIRQSFREIGIRQNFKTGSRASFRYDK